MPEQKCPACGFPVFNRRYAKCEKCGIALPETIVMSRQELRDIRERERQEDESAAELKRKQARRSANQSGDDNDYDFDVGNLACADDSSA
ncbi:MAG: hypothetical protein HYR68_05365 [Burkholderiales bacterium]|nr:hypothetical protein [Burkholderiales bacterium]MBI3727262.1 hypothetical protein [Burkholderiales bacterium]